MGLTTAKSIDRRWAAGELPQWARPSCKLCSIQKAPWRLLRFCGRSSRAAHSWSAANSRFRVCSADRQIGQTGPTEYGRSEYGPAARPHGPSPSRLAAATLPVALLAGQPAHCLLAAGRTTGAMSDTHPGRWSCGAISTAGSWGLPRSPGTTSTYDYSCIGSDPYGSAESASAAYGRRPARSRPYAAEAESRQRVGKESAESRQERAPGAAAVSWQAHRPAACTKHAAAAETGPVLKKALLFCS
jgi:hypothetical protein